MKRGEGHKEKKWGLWVKQFMSNNENILGDSDS